MQLQHQYGHLGGLVRLQLISPLPAEGAVHFGQGLSGIGCPLQARQARTRGAQALQEAPFFIFAAAGPGSFLNFHYLAAC